MCDQLLYIYIYTVVLVTQINIKTTQPCNVAAEVFIGNAESAWISIFDERTGNTCIKSFTLAPSQLRQIAQSMHSRGKHAGCKGAHT